MGKRQPTLPSTGPNATAIKKYPKTGVDKSSKNTAALIKPASLRQSPDHGCEYPKPTYDCSARFCARLGAGRRGASTRACIPGGRLPSDRIRRTVLFGLGIPQSLAAASVKCGFDGVSRPARLAGNKLRRVDRQTGMHHRRTRIPPLRVRHDPLFRGEFAAAAAGQATPITLPATPPTVVWGYYSAEAKPVLTVHSGDTVRIQTLSTCGSNERLIKEGVAPSDIPSYNGDIYREVKDKGPGGHILTGPVDIAEAEPGDVGAGAGGGVTGASKTVSGIYFFGFD